MGRIFDKLKKVEDKNKDTPPAADDLKDIAISDMKKQILEALKDRSAAALTTGPAPKPSVSAEDILNIIKKPGEPVRKTTVEKEIPPATAPRDKKELDAAKRQIEEYHAKFEAAQDQTRKMAASRDDAVKQHERLRRDFESKDRIIQGLQKSLAEESRKLKEERERSAANAEMLKTRDKRIAEADRLYKELESVKKLAEEYRVKADNIHADNKKISAVRDEALKQYGRMINEAEKKERVIQDLQKKTARISELEEALRTKDRRTSEAERIYKELDNYKRTIEEYKMKLENTQGDAKRLAALHGEAADIQGKLQEELAKKGAFIQELQKKVAGEIDEVTKEKEKIAANVEGLRSKLYASTKESKEQAAKISQLEEALKLKDRKIAETDRLLTELGVIKNELEAGLNTGRENNRNLEEKISALTREMESKDAKIAGFDKLYRELEEANSELEMRLQSTERNNKDLEGKTLQLNGEIDAKNARLGEADKIYGEMEGIIKDVTAKLQASQRDRKELEAKVSELNAETGSKDREIAELGKTYKKLDTARNELESKLHSAMDDSKDFEEKISVLKKKIESGDEKVRETNKLCKELESANNELSLELQSAERDKKNLEAKMSQLKSEIDAKNLRLIDLDQLQGGMEAVIKEVTSKLQASQGQTEELEKKAAALDEKLQSTGEEVVRARASAKEEADRMISEVAALKNAIKEKERKSLELKNTIDHLESEIQARDTKIEADIKYTERLVKEVGYLRKRPAGAEKKK